jgi:hypothetical protein
MLEEVAEKAPATAVYGSLGYMYAYNGKLSKALNLIKKHMITTYRRNNSR